MNTNKNDDIVEIMYLTKKDLRVLNYIIDSFISNINEDNEEDLDMSEQMIINYVNNIERDSDSKSKHFKIQCPNCKKLYDINTCYITTNKHTNERFDQEDFLYCPGCTYSNKIG